MKGRIYLVKLIDYFYREPLMKLRIAKEKGLVLRDKKESQPYIFMVDGSIPHGGMFDRLKGLITIYAVAKTLGKDFRINWTYPFLLSKYLIPSKYNWLINESQMNFGIFSYHNVIAYGEYVSPNRLMKSRTKETHFYYGYNSLNEVNKVFKTNYSWGELYRELFQPTPYLQRYLDCYSAEIGQKYVAIHARFLNLLGDKVETAINPELASDKEKEKLVELAISAVRNISSLHPHVRVMIASDSMVFINRIKLEVPNVYIVPGEVKHIDTAGETDDAENIKMFTDYYLISGAQKVYSLWHEGMWKSAFPEYAALIGGVPFERIVF